MLYPWQILVAAMAGWITRQQDAVIEYLRVGGGTFCFSRQFLCRVSAALKRRGGHSRAFSESYEFTRSEAPRVRATLVMVKASDQAWGSPLRRHVSKRW